MSILSMTYVEQLNDAAKEGNIHHLYTLIQSDPNVLEHFESIPFVETPLHVAACAGNLEFATEIMRLKPSFALKPNQEGWCPIHLALQNDQKRMVLQFVKINSDLVRVMGREGFTPLHFVTQTQDVELINKFLELCPDSIKEVTGRSETALHIAIKHQQYEALQILFSWLHNNVSRGAAKLESTILNMPDEAGNTILHISALQNDTKAIKLLMERKELMNVKLKNWEMLTAFDMASEEEVKRMLVNFGRKNKVIIFFKQFSIHDARVVLVHDIRRIIEDISDARREVYMVVATLIATATYQTSMSPPGGLYQADSYPYSSLSHLGSNSTSMNFKSSVGVGGNSVMSTLDFLLFSFSNTIAFYYSTWVIYHLLPRGSLGSVLYLPMWFLQFSYFLSLLVIAPTPATTIFVAVFWGYLFLNMLMFSVSWRPNSNENKNENEIADTPA